MKANYLLGYKILTPFLISSPLLGISNNLIIKDNRKDFIEPNMSRSLNLNTTRKFKKSEYKTIELNRNKTMNVPRVSIKANPGFFQKAYPRDEKSDKFTFSYKNTEFSKNNYLAANFKMDYSAKWFVRNAYGKLESKFFNKIFSIPIVKNSAEYPTVVADTSKGNPNSKVKYFASMCIDNNFTSEYVSLEMKHSTEMVKNPWRETLYIESEASFSISNFVIEYVPKKQKVIEQETLDLSKINFEKISIDFQAHFTAIENRKKIKEVIESAINEIINKQLKINLKFSISEIPVDLILNAINNQEKNIVFDIEVSGADSVKIKNKSKIKVNLEFKYDQYLKEKGLLDSESLTKEPEKDVEQSMSKQEPEKKPVGIPSPILITKPEPIKNGPTKPYVHALLESIFFPIPEPEIETVQENEIKDTFEFEKPIKKPENSQVQKPEVLNNIKIETSEPSMEILNASNNLVTIPPNPTNSNPIPATKPNKIPTSLVQIPKPVINETDEDIPVGENISFDLNLLIQKEIKLDQKDLNKDFVIEQITKLIKDESKIESLTINKDFKLEKLTEQLKSGSSENNLSILITPVSKMLKGENKIDILINDKTNNSETNSKKINQIMILAGASILGLIVLGTAVWYITRMIKSKPIKKENLED
ncbi:hypothetical protein [Spiroplasma alleghenense]|uniref:Uncharacterized protein n=1 Tax=Spiroplasma alleghenense TaxID=216931 RepID=A0A345Z424_9MOLU|nr:hypothetical protein [Spiroplasma alleghenense]AXK51353.1 hypothetical protein SALLE_v1c06830 [Spiroplasma alleghenense]